MRSKWPELDKFLFWIYRVPLVIAVLLKVFTKTLIIVRPRHLELQLNRFDRQEKHSYRARLIASASFLV